jgi:hypothetical protein
MVTKLHYGATIYIKSLNSLLLLESKEQRGKNSNFLFLGRTVRADIFGGIFFKKTFTPFCLSPTQAEHTLLEKGRPQA